MALSVTAEEYKERLLDTLRNDKELAERKVAFWERDLSIYQYTDAQRERLQKDIDEETELIGFLGAFHEAITDIEEV